ncbi:alpha/beta hydrolase [Rossellomorea aquimaris]|uniref:alpha/beta hydrolase n=1 Tax=Rossellomorea aquimaris TaxID=189382 RepID=UPI0007D05EC2|nr:alpha/beta hydrolase [Rossellomorea aquimaris]
MKSNYLSMSDQHKIFTIEWGLDEGRPKGVIQLSHGMAEHILRYSDFAEYAVAQGFIVIGHDHRGHGQTAEKNGTVGFFSENNGFERAVEDIYEINQWIHEQHPHTPIILFGHSMGSFLARRYIQLYDTSIKAVILSGTGGNPGFLGKVGIFLAKREIRKKGNKTESPLLDKLSFGNFNKSFKPANTAFDWLSRDPKEVEKYIEDPLCGRISTSGFFYDLFSGLQTIHQRSEIERTRKNLPIYLYSGSKDPVGKNGAGVQSVATEYKSIGMNHIQTKIYPEGRHEMLNETNKDEVYKDTINWINSVLE